MNLFEINSRSSGKTGEIAIYSSLCIDSGRRQVSDSRKFRRWLILRGPILRRVSELRYSDIGGTRASLACMHVRARQCQAVPDRGAEP